MDTESVEPGEVSAVIVTRGNVELTEIVESLPFFDVTVVDNSAEPVDLKVYGRSAGNARDDDFMRRADVVFTAIAPFRRLYLGHENLPWATGPDRTYTSEVGFLETRQRVLEKAVAAAATIPV